MNMSSTTIYFDKIEFPDQQVLVIDAQDDPRDLVLKTVWRAMDEGIDVYHAAVAALAVVTGCYWIAFCVLAESKEQAEVKAIWKGGKFVEVFQYDIEHTPCKLVLDSSNILVFDKVRLRFPLDKFLQDPNCEDYMGLSIRDIHGNAVGHIYMLDSKPLTQSSVLEKTLGVVAEAVRLEI